MKSDAPPPAPVGVNLAAMRRRSGLTAADLASRVPESGITRSLVVNIENGRKRDLTTFELAQLASALGVSPLELLVNTARPWSTVQIPGLAASQSGMSAAEYLESAKASDPRDFDPPMDDALTVLMFLRRAEGAYLRRAVLVDEKWASARERAGHGATYVTDTDSGQRTFVYPDPPAKLVEEVSIETVDQAVTACSFLLAHRMTLIRNRMADSDDLSPRDDDVSHRTLARARAIAQAAERVRQSLYGNTEPHPSLAVETYAVLAQQIVDGSQMEGD